MFSGIVEATSLVKSVQNVSDCLQLKIEKPSDFDDLSHGDSVCVDGVCLTVEEFTDNEIQFSAGAETLHITGWTESNLPQKRVNLERSLRWGDRVHGHLVTGHVDTSGTINRSELVDGTHLLEVEFPAKISQLIWEKGCVALNGVSLTINRLTGMGEKPCLAVGLIPETVKRTNLEELKPGQSVNIETDYYAKGFLAARRFDESTQGVQA